MAAGKESVGIRGRLQQAVLDHMPDRWLTRRVARWAEAEVPVRLRGPLYSGIARAVGADNGEASEPLETYPSVNAWFTRSLRPGVRPWRVEAPDWGMPADGRLDVAGTLGAGQLVQAKGLTYGVVDFLGDAEAATTFADAWFGTIYLSPKDYHRVHAPCTMDIDEVWHLGGRLLPVNGMTVPTREGVFVENERVVFRFRDETGTAAALVMVAATVVGGIRIATERVSLRQDHEVVCDRYVLSEPWRVAAGDELGVFAIGSTVVLLRAAMPVGLRSCPDAAGLPRTVRLGEPLLSPHRLHGAQQP